MTASEAQIHQAVLQYLLYQFPRAVIHHSPNEGVRGGAVGILDGAKRKAMGMCAGFPDIEVLPDRSFGPMYFEIKAADGRVSPAQRDVLDRLVNLGYHVAVVRSVDDAKRAVAGFIAANKLATDRRAIK